MKKLFSIFILAVITYAVYTSASSQSRKETGPAIEVINAKNNSIRDDNPRSNSYTTVVSGNSSLSTNGRAPQGSRAFVNSCYFISKGELDSSGFGADTVFSVGWTWEASTSQSVNTTGSLKVYIQNTSDTAYNKGLNFSTALSGMSKVIDGIIKIPYGSGPIKIDIPVGGTGTSLPFIRNSGNSIYLAFEYQTTTTLATPLGAPTILCNSLRGNSIGTYQSQVANGTSMTLSAFRPETRFSNRPLSPLEVKNIYALGQYPYAHVTNDTICIQIIKKTLGSPAAGVCIRIVNQDNPSIVKFSHSINLPNLISQDTIVCFETPPGYEPKLEEILVNALIADTSHPTSELCEDIMKDTTETPFKYCQEKNNDSYNYRNLCMPDDGGLGLSGTTGNFVASFKNSGTDTFTINNIDHSFFNILGGASQPYKIVILSDNGSGMPGSLLYLSSALASPVGTGTVQNVTHIVSPPVKIATNRRFYVGYRQTSTANITSSFQYEVPIRSKAFFYSIPDTSNSWTDFSTSGVNFRMDISPRSGKRLNLNAFLQGMYNPASNLTVKDTLQVLIRNAGSPYSIIENSKSMLKANGTSPFTFNNVSNGISYYIVLKHRNSVETWSGSTVSFSSNLLSYDFTTAANKAFGSNMIQIDASPVRFGIYTGDVNQDNVVDGTDALEIDNDATNFVSGYVDSDLNGDEIVDGTDAALCDNNSYNFVGLIRP
jgi:hypothetical protein